jgi:hypothetical protein
MAAFIRAMFNTFEERLHGRQRPLGVRPAEVETLFRRAGLDPASTFLFGQVREEGGPGSRPE